MFCFAGSTPPWVAIRGRPTPSSTSLWAWPEISYLDASAGLVKSITLEADSTFSYSLMELPLVWLSQLVLAT